MKVRIGKVALTMGGAWSNTTSYAKLTYVTYNGDGWISLADNINVTPGTDAAKWAQATDVQSFITAMQAATAQAVSTNERLVAAELLRVQAENARVTAEQGRVTAESSRVDAEAARVQAESGRVTAEQGRVTAESGRVDAEASRVQAEQLRVNAEVTRNDNVQTAVNNANTATVAAQGATTVANEAAALAVEKAALANEAAENADALQEALESGEVVPALAGDLASWAGQTNPIEDTQTSRIFTTGGDASIDSSVQAVFSKLVATTDCNPEKVLVSGKNLLRLENNNGWARAVGAGWYIPVPALPYGEIGKAATPNGLLLSTDSGQQSEEGYEIGTNLKTATVYFKKLSDGVPTSVTDGTACAYTDATDPLTNNVYRFYTCQEPGFIIISGITWADTCARIGWSGGASFPYDMWVSPTDADDAGASIDLTATRNACQPDGKLLVVDGEGDEISRSSDTALAWTRRNSRVQPTWTTEDNGDETYTHTATIVGMKSDGKAEFENDSHALTVSGDTISYTDNSDTASTDYVQYQLATAVTGTQAVTSTKLSVEDYGLMAIYGGTGDCESTFIYGQGMPDTLRQIAKYKVGEIQANLETLTEETKTTEAELQAQITALQAIVGGLNKAEGYVRVAGSSSPALSYKHIAFDTTDGFGRESAFSLLYPCLVGTKLTGDDEQVGKVLHVLQKLGARTVNNAAVWLDINGVAHAIDGSEGDVMICNVEEYYRIMGRHTIEGTEYDVFLMSRTPFTWQGIVAERVDKGGVSPDYTVSHLDADNVRRMHSVYNPAWNGDYTAPAGVVGKFIYTQDGEGNITETYDASATLLGGAGGLHTTNKALYTGEQEAMNQNPDTTKCVPFMNQTAASVENWFAMMLAEGGTFDAHNATLMGSGFSANDGATSTADWDESGSGAKNGVRIYDKDGAAKMYNVSGNAKTAINLQDSSDSLWGTIVNSHRNPFHIMEAHRAVSFAVAQGVGELEWFVFEGNKYKYRSVTGFAGPQQGEMTCVVWKMLSSKLGSGCVDPTDKTTSIEGNRIDLLFSVALYHGITTQVSPSWWTSGLVFTEDDAQNHEAYMQRDQALLIKTPNGEIASTAKFDFEDSYDHVGETMTSGAGYRKNYANGALMVSDTNAHKTGGGLHTYVGAYNYYQGAAASSGKKLVRGFRRGYAVYHTVLSPLYVAANSAPSITNALFAFGTCCRIRD